MIDTLRDFLDRIREDPEASRLMGEVIQTTLAQKEAEQRLRDYLAQSTPAASVENKPDVKEPPLPPTTDSETTKPKTIGKKAFDLIVAANGALCTTSDLAKTLGLTEIQVSQGLRDYVKNGLLKKPFNGVWAWTGGSNGNGHAPSVPTAIGEMRSGSFQEKMLGWMIEQGKMLETTAISEAMGHPLTATKATLHILRVKGFIEKTGKDLWRVKNGITKEANT